MERLKPGPLADSLERSREHLNARVAQARRLDRSLDLEDFGRHLVTTVAPIVEAAAKINPDPAAIDRVVEALFDVSLDLFRRDCLGEDARWPAISTAWTDLLPALGRFVASDPARVAAAVSNATFNLSTEGIDALLWIQGIASIALLCPDSGTLLAAGKALSWKCGMAHYRESAVETLKSLPDEIVYPLIGVAGVSPRPSRDELFLRLSDPWRPLDDRRDPSKRRLEIVARVGGFRGFGGNFLIPPHARAFGGQLFASDGEQCCIIHADRFGAVLKRSPEPAPEPDTGAFSLSRDGTVKADGLSFHFKALAGSQSHASDGRSLAVTMPRSHFVYLVAVV